MTPLRRLIAAAAVAAFTGAVALTPSEVRSQHAPATAPPEPPPNAASAAVPVVEPAGDPFGARARDDDDTDGARPAPATAAAPFPFALARIGALPPNAGAGTFPLGPPVGAALSVSAIVVGAHPSALIDDGTTSYLVKVGDRVAGRTVVAIDANGVALGDGRRLTLAPAGGERE